MKKLIYMAAFMAILINDATAVTREDVLECGLTDGSKFILRSAYEWSMVPLPSIHSSRETNRSSWDVSYQDRSGQRMPVPASVDYRGKTKLNEACAYFGMKNGVPLAPFSFLRADRKWSPQENFPVERLDVNRSFLPDGSPVLQALQRAGIKSEAFRFGWIFQQGERLFYEKPLYRADAGYAYSIPVDAVYQAWSSDGGKTWSEGQVSTDVRIFELGRGWMEQSIRARPLSLNGKSVP